MGLAVLPSRLKKEMGELKDIIEKCAVKAGDHDGEHISALLREEAAAYPELESHLDWACGFIKEYSEKGQELRGEALSAIVDEEIGKAFCRVLEDAGVFKCTEEGRRYFDRFMKHIGYEQK